MFLLDRFILPRACCFISKRVKKVRQHCAFMITFKRCTNWSSCNSYPPTRPPQKRWLSPCISPEYQSVAGYPRYPRGCQSAAAPMQRSSFRKKKSRIGGSGSKYVLIWPAGAPGAARSSGSQQGYGGTAGGKPSKCADTPYSCPRNWPAAAWR